MKKILTIVLTAALLVANVSLYACSGESDGDKTTTTAASGGDSSSVTTAATTTAAATTTVQGDGDAEPLPTSDFGTYFWFDLNDNTETDWTDSTEATAGKTNLTVEYNATISSLTNVEGYEERPDQDLPAEGPQNLFDNDPTTKLCCGTGAIEDHYVVWTMDQPVKATSYVLTTANDNEQYPLRNAEAWALLATNEDLPDGWDLDEDNYTVWTVLDIVYYTVLPDENYKEVAYTIDEENQGAYSTYMWYCLYCEGGAEGFQLSEITLYGSAE